jgi:hypothetical protein
MSIEQGKFIHQLEKKSIILLKIKWTCPMDMMFTRLNMFQK